MNMSSYAARLLVAAFLAVCLRSGPVSGQPQMALDANLATSSDYSIVQRGTALPGLAEDAPAYKRHRNRDDKHAILPRVSHGALFSDQW